MTLELLGRRLTRRVSTEPTRTRTGHYPCFDGLRAIAALTVIGVHSSFQTGFTTKNPGWGRYTSRLEIGVEVFFVLSGFLLYRPFAAAHFGGRPAPATRTFWIRRLKRIVPAYWIAFIVATYVLRANSGGPGWRGPLIYLSFMQIYFPHYILHGLSQAWSLCIEMSFYLMIPLYGAALARTRRDPGRQLRAELIGLGILTAISFAWRIPLLSWHGSMARTMPNWLPGYLDQFCLGMVLAVASSYLAARDRRPGWLWHPATAWACWVLAAVCFWAVSNIGLPLLPGQNSPLGASLARQTLYGLFAFFLVVPAVFGEQHRGILRGVLRWRPLALIGVVSYGVYLWHEAWMHMYFEWTGDHLFDVPWLHFTVVVTALAVLSATLSYRLVERPILRSGHTPSTRSEPLPVPQPGPAGVVAQPIGAH